MRLIGAHVSASGGIERACARAKELGCNYMQIFTSSPRVWKSAKADSFDLLAYEEVKEKYSIENAVIHAMYLINLASDNPSLVDKSVEALIQEMKICAKLKLDGVVVHLGSHQGRGYEAVRKQLMTEIKRVLVASPSGSKLLIENSAGQKGKIASELGEVRDLLDGVDSEKLGWCLDTCHAHAAGYTLGLNRQELLLSLEGNKSLAGEVERLNLWKDLVCIHVNGSRDEFGSGRDRHANLGEGELSLDDIGLLLNQSQVMALPLVLEVPGYDGKGPDKKNVQRLKGLVIK